MFPSILPEFVHYISSMFRFPSDLYTFFLTMLVTSLNSMVLNVFLSIREAQISFNASTSLVLDVWAIFLMTLVHP